MKICIVNFSKVVDSTGGAEKVLCNLANEMVKRGHSVMVVCSEERVGKTFFPLDNKVHFYNIGINVDGTVFRKGLRKIFKIINFDYKSYLNNKVVEKKLADIIENSNPDIIINFFPKDLTYIVKVKKDIPVIQMLHGSAEWFENNVSVTVKKYLRQVKALQVLLPSYADKLSYLNIEKIYTIPNVVENKNISALYSKKIVYLARYDVDKQMHLLIDAFAKCANFYVDWQVHIYGTVWTKGYKKKLLKQIEKYKLSNRIFCHDRTNEPLKVLADSSICAFPSKYEGFPLALTEAMSIGLPCIGFKSCTGVNELIENGVNGFLVKDVDDFAEKLCSLMSDKELCIYMGKEAKEKVNIYCADYVYDQWENLLIAIVEETKTFC